MVKRFYIITLFYLLTFSMSGQNLLSYVTVSNTSPYVGQPVQVKVNVYTTTWFTSGIDVGNIQVDNALTVYFRSVSSVKTINGKKYAGVEFYYNLFPTREGNITIPSLEIHVETPKEGDYKGIKRILRTNPKSIKVKPVPLGYDPQKWLVANSLSINQKWSMRLTDIKVGDVVQRTINRSASGTLSEFIPATQWDSIVGVSLYPNRPKVNTNKSRTSVSSNRVETVSYLFEKEGEIVIPARTYMYWNALNKKFYQKQIDSMVILVKPNADLAMLTSIKKSLQKEKAQEIQAEEKPFLIFGLAPKTFFQYLIIGLVVLYLLFKIAKRVFSFTKIKYNNYLNSESYAFTKVKKAIKKNDYYSFLELIPSWLSRLQSGNNSLQDMAHESGSKELEDVLNHINEVTFSYGKTAKSSSFILMLVEIKKMRKNYFEQQKKKKRLTSMNNKWLNPTTIS